MNMSKLAPIALWALLAACSQSPPEASIPSTNAATDAAGQTQASYGDEAPVAIKAEDPKTEGEHAHNADGSHAEDDAHPSEADGNHPAEAEDAHPHEAGEADHDH